VPAHCSALGKVLYAAGAIDLATIPLERRTEHTITDPAVFATHLDEIRTQGYAVTLGELEIGLDAVAAPVLAHGGGVVAALGISGPSNRIDHRLPQLGALLTEQAAELSRALGHDRPHTSSDRTGPAAPPHHASSARSSAPTSNGKEGAA